MAIDFPSTPTDGQVYTDPTSGVSFQYSAIYTAWRSTAQITNLNIPTSLGVGTNYSNVTGEIRATNNITAYYSSDIRLKENIKNIDNAILKISSINGVEFDWTDDYIKMHGGEDGYFIRKHDVGIIAQEIERVLPEIVATRGDGTKAVKYDKIVALLIESIKELKNEINTLKEKVK